LTLFSFSTTSPVSESIAWLRMRLPVSRLMMLQRIRLDVLVAVYIATAHETSDSFR
jgi:hypothetical protein